MIQAAIDHLLRGQNLTREQIDGVVDEIASGIATDSQIAALLVCMRMKGETPEEIAGLAASLRRYSIAIRPRVNGRMVDNCGTGGDRTKTFNISTLSALVAAGAGVIVAKHGNRSATSRYGSADLLEGLGLNLNASPEQVEKSIESIGIGFIYAPVFHPALKHVSRARREIGARTIFNLLGPLINPAPVDAQVVGVYDPTLVMSMARVVSLLGVEEAMVLHSLDGVDEITLSNRTVIASVKDGKFSVKEYLPRDFGLPKYRLQELMVSSGDECRKVALQLLNGDLRNGAKHDTVVVNASASILVSGLADRFSEAIEMAKSSLDSGRALVKLKELVAMSGGRPLLEEVGVSG
ncbi:MAG: anthranilate phosphoribosyltransferase [Conexivisphaerales archaeon]